MCPLKVTLQVRHLPSTGQEVTSGPLTAGMNPAELMPGAASLRYPPSLSEVQKVLTICKHLHTPPTKMTPKRFLQVFLESSNPRIAYLFRHWAQPKGIKSTMDLLHLLNDKVSKSEGGCRDWIAFIKQDVSCNCVILLVACYYLRIESTECYHQYLEFG